MTSLVTSAPTPEYSEVIDGHNTTIGLAAAHQIQGTVSETVAALLAAIIETLTQGELDYWGEVESDVITVVGEYINTHNMDQVRVYQEDLVTLMERYIAAPEQSDTYPDKNEQASALSTSIITHRYLTEAAIYPESMILHFQDISSIHALVLQDAAETYSYHDLPPSRWWVDLSQELDHYIAYGQHISNSLRTNRLSLLSCHIHSHGGYDTYTATDGVTGEQSECVQLEESGSCDQHCPLFYQHKIQEIDSFLAYKVTDVLDSWQTLKELADHYAPEASSFYDPLKGV
ncbi:hypothetical protein Pmani_001673 [Petrolisthes manimaculis]|uniref:Uncharacterized protein n=1 Tax=Petrolisthes manimaculis TaxID=1843537 RepID=A0AAE1QK34_9EUCA|nr:hypothetical protein Pmani_001673 [Petrolisthes manimaculis]